MSSPNTTAENDAEDVNAFLKRIQELGTKRDQEDEERNRRLEEDIMQGRKERQARRAERARSISPLKDSPLGTPQSSKSGSARFDGTDTVGGSPKAVLSQLPDLRPVSPNSMRDPINDAAVEGLTSDESPTKENITRSSVTDFENADFVPKSTDSIRASPSSAMPTRTPTLSWQQRRPTSQVSERPRSRPLSMIASENAARSPRATSELSSTTDEYPPLTREQIAQSLATKDPAWFRQTADRGQESPAYRKNQVEDNDVMQHGRSSRIQMPGMTREVSVRSGDFDAETASTTSRSGSTNSSIARSSYTDSGVVASGLGSPVPQSGVQRFTPPDTDMVSRSGSDSTEARKHLAMSPAQGRISPERLERPSSPTKGMGGFVQSAMMKRSDSVNKRWSVQSPPGLSRGNSIASNRGSYDPTASLKLGGIMSPSSSSRPGSPSRDSSPRPSSRPASSHSNATVTQEVERPGTANSMKSSTTSSTKNEGFVRPSLPASRSQGLSNTSESKQDVKGEVEVNSPSSPAKASGRWSPTKSSWLESALNKPDSPKPKVVANQQQPAWMAEISKAKQKGAEEAARNPTITTKHEVNIGGLLRSPPMGGVAKPLSIGGLPAGFSSGSAMKPRMNSVSESSTKSDDSISAGEFRKSISLVAPSHASLTKPSSVSNFVKEKSMSPITNKTKPETPPKKDFRSNLKPRQPPIDSGKTTEPEFKNVIGQLRRTKTQNYVAPDELKSNILRGKAELNLTDGPKKTERKDELKDAILKKKEDFKKAQMEGTGVTRPARSMSSATTVPEALAKAALLGRSSTTAAKPKVSESSASNNHVSIRSTKTLVPNLGQESDAAESRKPDEGPGSKLAARFNPNLASILARGPPTSSEGYENASVASSARAATSSDTELLAVVQNPGTPLTHMTKERARGPKRKAPTSTTKATDHPTRTLDKEVEKAELSLISTSSLLENVAMPTVDRSQPFSEATSNLKENTTADTVEPSSPKKLDLKRRSQFLEGSSAKSDPPLKQPQTSKPTSPIQAAVETTPLRKTVTPKPSPISTPGPKPKMYGTTPSPNPAKRFELETPSPETARKLTPAPLSPSKSTYSNVVPKTPSASYNKEFENIAEQSPSFIKNATAMFGRSPDMQLRTTPVKNPIKLPTQADENAAEINAGLRRADDLVDNKSNKPLTRHLPDPLLVSKRPLPTPPPKPSGALLATPRNVSNSSTPGSSDTSKVLIDFFGVNDSYPAYKVDTAAVLTARAEDAPKIKSLRAQLLQLTDTGKKLPVPNHQERILFESNMYLCPHTYGTSAGKRVTEVYFWVGDDVPESVVDDAHVFAQREAKNAGGALVPIKQCKETPEFIEALGGIAIIRRGSSNKYDSLAPHILCGRRHQGQIVFDEVDFATASLCSGFPYLVSTQGGKLFLWKGKGSSVDELSCARLIGMDSGLTGEIEEVTEGDETAEFLAIFSHDAKVTKSADHWRLKPNYAKYCARLFCANGGGDGTSQISEIVPFTQHDISPSKVYILDAFFEIYIIVGSASQTQYDAFCIALLFAQEYGILAAGMEDRPFVPVSTVILEGVPRDLKFVFRKWKDALSPTTVHSPLTTLSRGRSLRVVTLNAALDATQR